MAMPVAHVIPPSLRAFGIDEVQPQQKLDPNKYEGPRGGDRRDAFDATLPDGERARAPIPAPCHFLAFVFACSAA